MRQLLFAYGTTAPTASTTIENLGDGNVGFFYLNEGANKASVSGSDIKGYGSIVMGRTSENGGPVVLPFYNKNFRYSKQTYKAATKFAATFTISDLTILADHSVIFVKKGVQFNERSNYTASSYVKNSSKTASDVAKEIVDYVNNNTSTLGLTATNSEASITVEAVKAGVDYEIIPADALYGTDVTYTTRGIEGIADEKAVKKFADMAAADAGYEYTYREDAALLYSNYPFNPLATPDKEDKGFIIYTLYFAVPRDIKTVDELVNQCVQIILPNESTLMSYLDTVLEGIKNGETPSGN